MAGAENNRWFRVRSRDMCCGLEPWGSCLDCPGRKLPDGTRLAEMEAKGGMLFTRTEHGTQLLHTASAVNDEPEGATQGGVDTSLQARLKGWQHQQDREPGGFMHDTPIMKLARALEWVDASERHEAVASGSEAHLQAKAVRVLIELLADTLFAPPTSADTDDALEHLESADGIAHRLAAAVCRRNKWLIEQRDRMEQVEAEIALLSEQYEREWER